MTSTSTTPVLGEGVALRSPTVQAGLLTYLGIATAIVGAVGSIVAAVQGNDVATATAGLTSLAATIRTIDARGAQAVALIERGAASALPYVEVLAAGDEPAPRR